MNSLEVRARYFFLRCRSNYVTSHCRSNRHSSDKTKRSTFSSYAKLQNNKAPYYVTTPIFYVNAEPHAGHLYTTVLADVLKRWHVLKGDNQSALLTGTDEHGMKIQKAAAKAKMDTKLFCDKHAKQFLELAQKANISYDRFIRTTDSDHIDAVEAFWQELQKRGYIYEAKHEGWYSVSDETFYPESQVHLILDPATGRKLHASIETGKEVEWTSETNYHFRLSAFRDRLLEHYRQHPDFIVPASRLNLIVKEVESGLTDLSISRPASRLTWGIPVPGDDSQTIYVWLDALINYLAATGYPHQKIGQGGMVWPPNCQVIGKDIIRFHCIYWPAFLMAIDQPLPKQFLTHAHWTMGRAKMSKSLGNGVNPFYAMNVYGVDTIRYFMTHDGGLVDDADYDNSFIVERYKHSLQGQLGNLASRIVRGKKWSIMEAVQQAATANLNIELSGELETAVQNFMETMKAGVELTNKHMNEPNPRRALHTIMQLVSDANKWFHDTKVWDLAKSNDPEIRTQVNKIIFTGAESLRICFILLQPFMPGRAEIALDWLGIDHNKRTFDDAKFAADYTYGLPLRDPGTAGTAGTLFPPLATDF